MGDTCYAVPRKHVTLQMRNFHPAPQPEEDIELKVAVLGAGVGGLSVAPLLAREGYDVTVFEKNSEPGGRARIWKKDGFVFDMGPSWYLMPEIFEH